MSFNLKYLKLYDKTRLIIKYFKNLSKFFKTIEVYLKSVMNLKKVIKIYL